MADPYGTARIEGLRDFARALKMADDRLPVALRQANNEAATSIRDLARQRANSQGGVARKAARSGLRASRSSREAAVILGGARAPYAFGAEFGAKKYRQFRPWRGNRFRGWAGGPGYFLFPTIRVHGQRIVNRYMERVHQITEIAFPD